MSSANIYLDFFGFDNRPFSLVPDSDFLFWSEQHKRAYAILEFGIFSSAPITLITGEIGTGKTTLIQKLLDDASRDLTFGLVSNAHGDRGELLQWILNALSVSFESKASYVEMFQILQDYLLEQYADGQRVIIVFDEAQNLTLEGLEELRLLTNINSKNDVLIQLILSGQPELRDMVKSRSMQQLAQRVAASFHLGPMDAETTIEYLSHRLKTAGGTGLEFTPAACKMIHGEAGGVPRLVNQLCEFCLLYAWEAESRVVDEITVRNVLDDDIFFKGYQPASPPLALIEAGGDSNG
ncbi:type II secretion system protein A [Roseivivax lentus]|uniref:Type II secretion system protein A n=1 Tax=Roseivivax lentus TaxID=633194 RepID=A0A1N7Q286_9RHOB|nr:AAA family ATPase [Roseivivax lentus]SIT16970.1 type II secretion system protein A [Roseivivax lentus]